MEENFDYFNHMSYEYMYRSPTLAPLLRQALEPLEKQLAEAEAEKKILRAEADAEKKKADAEKKKADAEKKKADAEIAAENKRLKIEAKAEKTRAEEEKINAINRLYYDQQLTIEALMAAFRISEKKLKTILNLK